MLQTFCFVVDLIPWHAKHFSQHTLNQMVTNDDPFGDLPSESGHHF
jgi:hypothetical protein